MNRILTPVVALLILGAGCPTPTTIAPRNFTECAAQDNPILESYPRQCKTPDGKTFVEPVTPPPAPPPTTNDCRDAGCSSGYTCIQKCGPPVARDTDPEPGYYCETKEIAAKPRNCPICLALNTLIATPNGDVRVQDLHAGDVVWSIDRDGARVVSTIVKTSKTLVPTTHRVIHLKLEDGRDVHVSPGHPTTDGRTVGDLKAGDLFDGSTVALAEVVPYGDDATYDLLPADETGAYWANGILLGSTLR